MDRVKKMVHYWCDDIKKAGLTGKGVTVAVLDGNEYKKKTLTVKLGKDDSASKDNSEESAAQDSQDSQDSQDESIEGGQDGSDQGDANAFADDGEASLFRDFEQNGLRD